MDKGTSSEILRRLDEIIKLLEEPKWRLDRIIELLEDLVVSQKLAGMTERLKADRKARIDACEFCSVGCEICK